MTTSPWPKPTPEDLDRFFGKIQLGADGYPREGWEHNFLRSVLLPYPMSLAWEPDVRVTKVRCHREVSRSLLRCLDAVLQHFKGEREAVHAAGLDVFRGCYSHRASQGTNFLSMHAYGAAFDFALPANVEMPIEVIEIFAGEGWAWGGDNKKRPEPGHFEAINRR